MPSLRRAVFRLLLITAFLLFVAWLAMKAMQYGGDWQRVLRDLLGDTSGIERFFNEQDYIRLRDSYILDMEKLKGAKKDMCILHPLPRVNEIAKNVDNDPRACYFKQVLNGKFIRMALILKLLEID